MKNDHTKSNKIRQWASTLWTTARRRIHKDVEAATEPIDFSAPSIPYYTGLANRFSLARTILYVLLVLFLVITIVFNTELITYQNLYYLVKDINAAALTSSNMSDYIGYPVSSNEPDFAVYRNGLVVAGSEEVTVLSAAGKQTLSDNVSYAVPCVRASDTYFITFGRGERSFRVYNAFLRLYSGDTDYPIYDACITDDGDFAVVSRSREYKSEVTVYDRDFRKIVSYRNNRYVTSAALSPDGNRLAMASATTENGTPYSILQIVRTGRDKMDVELRLDGIMVYQCTFLSSGRILVVGDTGAWIYATNGNLITELDISSGMPTLYATSVANGRTAFLLKSKQNFSENYLTIFDRNGKVVHTIPVSLSTEALDLTWGGEDTVYVRTSDSIVKVSPGRKSVERLMTNTTSYAIEITKDGGLLICTPSHAYRPDEKDWIADL